MSIDFPAPGQVPQLRALWKKAFGDGDDFLDPFFAIAFSAERCRCIAGDGNIAAALYWFETSCGQQRFAYVYAVATDPAFRGQGFCTALMADTARLLKEQGYHGILLYPASDTLAQMYGKMGYRRCTAVSEFRCEAAGEAVTLRRIGKEEYARLRKKLLPEGGVVQEGALLDFLASQTEFYAGEDCVAAVTADGKMLHCHELLGNVANAPGIVRFLHCEKGFFRTVGGQKSFAMVYPLAENCINPAYFGLPLD